MSQAEWQSGDDVSLFSIGTTVLRNRWRIIRWAMAGGIIAVMFAITKPAMYVASASFIPQGNDPSRSGLASLAGQFGVALPTANQPQSPDFYSVLLRSRVLLARIVLDTFSVQEMGGKRVPFLDLFKIEGTDQKLREEKGVALLTRTISTSVAKTTGIVGVGVTSRWPSVSLAITSSLVNGVNEFNQQTRQSQAALERKFVEGRLALAATELRAAEDRLENFLRTNRQFSSSPELTFQRDRLQRDVTLQQQVFTLLTQSYEEVRIREVRDTPAITVIEPPSVPSIPQSRGRIMSVLVGLVLGGSVGAALAFLADAVTRHRGQGDAEAIEFVGTLGEVLVGVRSLGARVRRASARQ